MHLMRYLIRYMRKSAERASNLIKTTPSYIPRPDRRQMLSGDKQAFALALFTPNAQELVKTISI